MAGLRVEQVVAGLQNDVARLHAEIDRLESECASLRLKLANATSDALTAAHAEITRLTTECDELETELEAEQDRKHSYREDAAECRAEIDRLEDEITRLTTERDTALETVRELSSKVDTTALDRWVGDFENQQRAERAETALTAAHAEITRLTDEFAKAQEYRRTYGKGDAKDLAKRVIDMCQREFGKVGLGVLEQHVACDVQAIMERLTTELDEARNELATARADIARLAAEKDAALKAVLEAAELNLKLTAERKEARLEIARQKFIADRLLNDRRKWLANESNEVVDLDAPLRPEDE